MEEQRNYLDKNILELVNLMLENRGGGGRGAKKVTNLGKGKLQKEGCQGNVTISD
jgi:hypothetical protein